MHLKCKVSDNVSIIQAYAGFCGEEIALVEGHLTLHIACLVPHAPPSRVIYFLRSSEPRSTRPIFKLELFHPPVYSMLGKV